MSWTRDQLGPLFAPDQRLDTSEPHLDDVSAELAYVAQQVSRVPVAASLLPRPLALLANDDVCCCQVPDIVVAYMPQRVFARTLTY